MLIGEWFFTVTKLKIFFSLFLFNFSLSIPSHIIYISASERDYEWEFWSCYVRQKYLQNEMEYIMDGWDTLYQSVKDRFIEEINRVIAWSVGWNFSQSNNLKIRIRGLQNSEVKEPLFSLMCCHIFYQLHNALNNLILLSWLLQQMITVQKTSNRILQNYWSLITEYTISKWCKTFLYFL